ncbi:amidophosphoribosyltransferase [Dictyobacter alpinus]|uniref:Amidophosphoribosyltransferase n=1 Tax=Dictyobacter alpinus TaxID=2014873 RepID=A0A402B8F7_9CHLR|nr:amidophosphoribosyltransferase [Dictyobacter alpinus]GCE27616.1 amidophosphoribosyltransferase [Dictyobacter alpinus]
MESLHDKCGVVGIYTRNPKAIHESEQHLLLSLAALQHRGQESAGIAIYNNEDTLFYRCGMGKVQEVFSDGYPDTFPPMKCGIGHVRYSTTGSSCIENAGPFVVRDDQGSIPPLALAHNGNIINTDVLRAWHPHYFTTSTTDSEIIASLLLHDTGHSMRERLMNIIPRLRGAYSLTILAEGKLYALRDPWGLRPLCVGYTDNTWIVASESCALDRIGATFIRQVDPGELITLDDEGMRSEVIATTPISRLCVLEPIYFADATSQLNGTVTYAIRQEIGRELAREYPRRADYVVPVPETSIPMAIAYADATNIPYEQLITRNRYSDRTFIKPTQNERLKALAQKFSFVKAKILGARLIIVDDSIVRGNTLKHLASHLRQLGAREIHLLSSSPPLRHTCHFGIDIPKETELIAAGRDTQEIAEELQVDSVGYLSLRGLNTALKNAHRTPLSSESSVDCLDEQYCFSCMALRGWPFRPQSRMNTPLQADLLPVLPT